MNDRQDVARPVPTAIGLRLTGMSDRYPPADEAERIATIRAGLDVGITLLDTGDFYGMGHNELLIREALHGYDREQVRISVNFGILRDPSGGVVGVDATRPVAVKESLVCTLRRLGTEYIDIYRPARLGPGVPVEETVGAIAELVDAGYVREIGLPTVDAGTLRRAVAVHPVADVRLELTGLPHGTGHDLLSTARQLGIGISADSRLSAGPHERRGCVTCAATAAPGRSRAGTGGPHQNGAARLVAALRQVASAIGATAEQVGIAWLLAQGPGVVALVDAGWREQLTEALGATSVRLGKRDLARIAAAVGLRPRPHTRFTGYPATPPPATGSGQQPAPMPLTAREMQVLDLVTAGMTNRAVASSLGISERTAREHVARILLKLRVESRVEAAVLATQWRRSGQ